MLRVFKLLPGLLLLCAVGYGGKFIEQAIATYGRVHHVPLPNIEYVLWAIIIGLIIANTVGVPKIFAPGVATYEFWLLLGIVMLGARFLIADVLKLGGISLAMVAVELALSIVIMTALGKWLHLKPKLTSLLAIGSSICGVSAIIAAKGAIDADDEDSSYAIAVILSVGAISLFIFPLVGHWLQLSAQAFGMWAGLAVDNTAEAVAAGSLYSDAAGKVAVFAKTARNATIGFVVLGFAWYWAKKGMAKEIERKWHFLWEKFPKFVLGFLLVSLLASVHFLDKGDTGSLGNISRWAFLLTFAGVGLRTNVREMAKQGLRPFIAGAAAEILIAGLTFAMVFATDRIVGF